MDRQFSSLIRRQGSLVLAALLFTGVLVPTTVAASPPIELYSRLPELSNPQLSPDGEHFAVEMSYQGSRVLVVRDTYGAQPPSVVDPGEFKIHDYEWVANDRLVLYTRATSKVWNFLFNYVRLFSVDKNGGDIIPFRMRPNDNRFFAGYPHIVSRLPDDPDHVLAVLNDEYGRYGFPEVERVNIYTGQSKLAQRNVRDIVYWLADEQGQLRIGFAINDEGLGKRGSEATIYHRRDENSEWEVVQKAGVFAGATLSPVGFDPDDEMVLLVSSSELQNTDPMRDDATVYRYDLESGEFIGEYVDQVHRDIEAMVREQTGAARAKVTSWDDDKRRMMVMTYSDVSPPFYYLYERDEQRLSPLGGHYPELESGDLAPMQLVEYRARDGRSIPGFLTLPKTRQGKPPLVVYPHGGPWARDYWGFDNYVQLLASRGYAVFQPQFRGSTGFGTEHLEAGYGQWGLAIQDDITDGVKWLIGEGKVDPDRICIYGASFGGYAAAMGAVKTPDLYQCAITVNGVLDLKKLVKSARYMPLGDANLAMWNDPDDVDEASPYHLYKQIKIPMLVIASDKDTVVPWVDHSKRFHKRLKKLDVESELVVLEDGEHWRTNEAHELQKMEAIIGFLDRHIGH
jgi:dipeptidyl aminopeptidase/acylaminoacyl peptidase